MKFEVMSEGPVEGIAIEEGDPVATVWDTYFAAAMTGLLANPEIEETFEESVESAATIAHLMMDRRGQ